MKINGKRKTPIIAAQSEKKDGTKAQTSRTTSKKNNGVKSAVLDRISDGVLALDVGLNYSYLNERAGELLGCNPSDLIGKSLWQAHPDVERTPFAEACRRALETQSVVMLDGYFPASDRWLEGRVYPSEEGVSVLFSEGAQQKQDENRRREERYRILFDTMQEGFLLAEVVQVEDGTPDARFLEVNASMCRFLARSRDELVGNTVQAVFQLDEEDSQVLERACRVALGQSEPFFLERYEAAAGCWLRAHIFSPRAGQFASLVTDITEQKEAEARLQDVSKFPGQNPNPILRFTPAGEVLYANQASQSLLSAWEDHAPHTTPLEEIQQRLPSVLEDGSNCEIEVTNNQAFYMGLLVPVAEEGYINLYLRDITERKQAEETLRAHIHQTNAGITRTDLEGRFTFVNQAFCDMLGYTEADLLGKTIWEISHPDDIARNRTMFKNLVKEGDSFQLEKRVLRRNGSFQWINVGSSPLRDASGRIQAATSIIVDITRRKRAEESLLESARRTLYLSSLGDAMRSQSDPSRIQIEAARLLGASLKASRVAYVEIEPDGNGYVRDHYVDNVPDIIGPFQIDSCVPADQMSRFRSGRTVTATDIQKDTRFDETQRSAQEALTVRAQIIVPFLRSGEMIAALCIQQDQPRVWRNEEVALVEETAERLQAEIERVYAERKLRESEERLQTAQKAGNVGIWDWDAATNKTYWSETMWTLHGYQQAREEKVWEQSQHPEDQQRVQEKAAAALASGDTEYRDEYRIIHPDGSVHWIESVARIIRDEAGKPVRMSGVNLDITERKKMENAIRESEERYRALISQATAGIAESDMDGRFTFVNPRFCEMLGYSEAELLAKTVFELTYVDDRAENRRLFERMVEEGESYQFEKRFIRRDGSLLWTDVSVTTIHDLDGKPKGGVGVVIDIEKRKQAEEALRGSEERMRLAIEANRMITWEWDPALDRITTSGNLPEVYGLAELNKKAEGFALVWPGDLPTHREKVERVKNHGGEYLSEFRITRPTDGRLVWMEERAAALTDEEGKVTRLAGVVTDITERKRAEQELAEFARQQAALYQLADRLNRTETLEEVFDPALDAILSALQCDRASILLYDPEDVMRFVAWRGLSDSYRRATDGHTPWTPDAIDPEPICMENVDLADLGEHLQAVIQKEGIGALAFIPLVSNGKLIGKFMVYFNTPHTFAEAEVGLSLTIARQLASTIDRKRTEAGLRLSEHKFSRLFHFAPFAVALQKLPDARFTEVNGEFIKLFGYSRDELIGRTTVDIGMHMDPVLREQTILEHEQFGVIRDAQFQARTKDGRIIWITVNADLVEINGEKYILSQADDITERSQAEQALRTSEELYRAIARSIPGGGVYVVDQDFRYRVAEGPVTEAFGLTREMLEGRTVTEAFPDERGIQMEERLRRNFAGEIVQFETRFNDRVYWTQQAPLQDSMGRVIILTLDITERKQAEEAMAADLANMQILRDLGARLVSEGNLHVIYQEFVRAAVTITHADAGTVQLLEEGSDELILLATQGLDQGMIEHFQRVKSGSATSCGIALARRERAFVDFDDPAAQDPEGSLRRHVESGLLSAQSTPLISRSGKPIGMISTHWRKHHRPTDQELRYIDLLARQATDLIERRQAEVALLAAREHAEETASRMQRLQKVTASLSDVLTPLQVLQVIVDQGAPSLGAVSGSVMLLTEDGQDLEMVYSNAQKNLVQSYQSFPISLAVPSADAVRSGQPVWLESRQQYLERYPHLADQIQQWGQEAALAIPMVHKGRTLGVLALSFEHVLPHSPEDQDYILTFARQGAQALGRARAEEALRDSEERYRAIISQATAGIVRKDATGRLIFVNQAFCNMLDMTETELLGRTMWELTHEEDVEENKRLYNRLMAEGIPFQLEKRLNRLDGSTLWVNVSVSPVMGETGRPQSAVSAYVDMTGRKQAENRLTMLARVSELTRQFEEPEDLLFAVSREVGEHFQVRRALFNEIDVENDREVVHRDYCQEAESVAGVHKLSSYSSITTEEMKTGRTVVNSDSKTDPRTAADYERSYVEQGERSYVAVPLMHDDQWVASLWISDDRPRTWDKDDVYLLEAIAERTWTAAEKMRVDRALRDSEERLRVMFNTTAAGFALLTPDTRFVDVNDALCHIVGYTREELVTMTLDNLVHPEFNKSTHDPIAQLLSGQVPSFSIEQLYLRGDGAEIWVQNSVSLVRDADGNPLHLIAICQDITERKRVEEELQHLNLRLEERVSNRTAELQAAYEFLRESEATSRLILESMPDAIVITDRDGRIVHANTQVETLFGYTANEVLGKPVEILLPKQLRRQNAVNIDTSTDQRVRRIMSLGQDLFGLRKEGSEFPVEVLLSPINNNTSWDVMVAIRDNTKQRQAQEALRINEEKLRTLFEILPVGISFLGKDGRIVDMNPALTEILGMSKESLLKGSYKSRRYIRSDGTPMSPNELATRRAITEQKTVYNVETGIVRENGEIKWTSVNAAPVRVADVEVVVATIDITERKQAEEAINRHRESLKLLSRRLVEVQEDERRAIARELHDRVGQNLAALTLNLNILRSQLTPEILDKIGTRLNDSVNLIKDVLSITRSVMADLRPNVLDDYGLDAALNEYADRFSQRFGIRVVNRMPATPTPRLDTGIEMTLLRIAQEALTNIARHAQASQASITMELEDNTAHMVIQDNGIGILSWQKVNQAGSHGIRIMRERAEAFGGGLKVHSAYKSGTTIEVRIPIGGGAARSKTTQEKRS